MGASVSLAIKTGMARSVFSNEAGWGSAPMIHASAKVDHPIKQGMMGIFEVFVDTFVVCTITCIVILITGVWNSGLDRPHHSCARRVPVRPHNLQRRLCAD